MGSVDKFSIMGGGNGCNLSSEKLLRLCYSLGGKSCPPINSRKIGVLPLFPGRSPGGSIFRSDSIGSCSISHLNCLTQRSVSFSPLKLQPFLLMSRKFVNCYYALGRVYLKPDWLPNLFVRWGRGKGSLGVG